MGLLNIASKPYGNELIASFGIALKLSSLVMFVVIGYNQDFNLLQVIIMGQEIMKN
ncbi:hypothetical protein Q5M85_00415 [Paraclostridium bifermentans]|nr:hypothetical protein [Paraclostridium bifermentans]